MLTRKIYHFLVLSLEWKTTVHVSNHGDYLSRWSHLHVFSFSQAYTEGGEPLGTLETDQESLFETYCLCKEARGGSHSYRLPFQVQTTKNAWCIPTEILSLGLLQN